MDKASDYESGGLKAQILAGSVIFLTRKDKNDQSRYVKRKSADQMNINQYKCEKNVAFSVIKAYKLLLRLVCLNGNNAVKSAAVC